jgi:O-antigen/teichoic acid export membrane protein/SAM-dependent methyltransferase
VIALLAGFLVTSVFNIPTDNQALARQCLYWIGITWCVTQIRQTFIGAVTALQRYEILNAGTMFSQTVTVMAGLGVLFLGGNLLDLVRAQAMVATLMGLGWLSVAHRLLPGVSFTPRIDPVSFRRTFGFGFWQMLNNVGGILAHQSQRWLLGILLPVATVGFYSVGYTLVSMVYSAAYKVGQVLFPAVSQMQGQARDEQAARLVVQANWILTTLSIAGFIPLVVFAYDFLYLWIGPDFAANTTGVLRILAIGVAAACLFAIPNFYLLGTGRSRWLAAMSFAQGIITLVVSALLIPRLGLAGAGWGLTSGTVVHVTVLILMWKRIFRVWIPARVYLSATFGQYVVGAILAVSLTLLRSAIAWSPNWVLLGGAWLVCAAFAGITMVIIDSALPGGAERRRLLLRLSVVMVPGLSRLKSQLNAQGLVIKSPIDHNSQQRLNEFYSNPKFVEAYLNPTRLKFYGEVIELLYDKGIDYNGKHIADIGCGTGHLLLTIRDDYCPLSLTGFEYSGAALSLAQTVVPDAKFYYLDIYDGINFQFDVVFCVEVLEHLLHPDKALKNVLRMINTSGTALITVPNGRIDTFEGHINFWSPESWEVFVKSVCNGFDVEVGLMEDGKTNFAIIKHTEYEQPDG